MSLSAQDVARVGEFVQREGMLLDERAWERWLELYEPESEYWVPMWDDDGLPTVDPQRELSLIYYPTRSGLEDRVFRIKSGKSSATMPMLRTSHIRPPPVIEQVDGLIVARFNWVTHAFRAGKSLAYFGGKTLWLRPHQGSFRIAKSYTLVRNDLIDQVLDVYLL